MPFKPWSSGACVLQGGEGVWLCLSLLMALLMVFIGELLQQKLQPSEILPAPVTCFPWLLTMLVPKLGG